MNLKYETYTTDNGISVLLIPDKSSYSVTITALFKSLSATETIKTQGITHFIEHISVLSTKSYPNREKLSKLRDLNGAEVNASTSKEILKYYINLPYTKLEFGMQNIYEILYEATYNTDLIEKERSTIIDEIHKAEDSPYQQLWQFIKQSLMPKNHSYIYDVAGIQETVSSFTKEELLKHYQKAHIPNNLTLVVTGNFKINHTKRLIKKYFSKQKITNDNIDFPQISIKTGRKLKKVSEKTDLTLTSLIIPTSITKLSDRRDIIKTSITTTILGGPTSSRLNNRLREKEGLLYHIYAYPLIENIYSLIEIGFDTIPNNSRKSLNIVLEELERFANDGITQDELHHYTEYLVNRLLVKYDNLKQYSNVLTSSLLANQKLLSIEEYIDLIRDIRLQEINDMIKNTYKIPNMNIIQYGKF